MSEPRWTHDSTPIEQDAQVAAIDWIEVPDMHPRCSSRDVSRRYGVQFGMRRKAMANCEYPIETAWATGTTYPY